MDPQQEAVINHISKLIPYERIEIMKDAKGHLGTDIIVFRSSKVRITALGTIIPMQIKSIIGKPEGE